MPKRPIRGFLDSPEFVHMIVAILTMWLLLLAGAFGFGICVFDTCR